MWNWISDGRFALRMALKNPWMSGAAVVALGAGMAVTIGGFSLIWDTRYAELPFIDGDRIVAIRDIGRPDPDDLPPTLAVFREWDRLQSGFDVIGAAFTRERDIADGAGGLTRHVVTSMTASGFDVAAVAPLLGRTLNVADQVPGSAPVTVLGFEAWRALFGADPEVVGKTLNVAGEDRLVVGVMPEGYEFPMYADLWVPLDTDPGRSGGVEPRWLRVFGRLAATTSLPQAAAELDAIRAGYAAEHPEDVDAQDRSTTVIPYVQSDMEPGSDVMFLGMFLFLVLILVVACASVANLLLARSAARAGEIAVRAALGASRQRLVTQLFIEALLLTSAGAVLGTLAAHGFMTWFASTVDMALPFWMDFGVNAAAVIFAVLAALGAALIAGIAPAMKATSVRMHDVLKDEQGTSSGLRFGRISAALTTVEVTLSVGFLAAAGLAAQSMMLHEDAGADLDGAQVLVATTRMVDDLELVSTDGGAQIRVPAGAIPAAQWKNLQQLVQQSLADLPGVEAATLALTMPGRQHFRTRVEVESSITSNDPRGSARVSYDVVSPEFLGTFNSGVVAGRNFGRLDGAGSERVAIVNEAFARRLLGGRNPVGERFRRVRGDDTSDWYRVVGVAADLRMNPANDVVEAGFYLPLSQTDPIDVNELSVAVRTDGDPLTFAAAVKETILAVDPRIDVTEFRTLDEMAAGFLQAFRLMGLIFVGIGGMALFLAIAGLYAVMAFSVAQRTREIGIRLALGASRRGVMGVVVRRGLLQVGIGILLGSALGWALLQLMSFIPLGIASGGYGLLAAASLAMLVAGLAACAVPASRALAIHPVRALRHH